MAYSDVGYHNAPIDEDGFTWANKTDPSGLVTQQIRPDGAASVSQGYNAFGQTLKLYDCRNNAWSVSYDGLGHVTQSTSPAGRFVQFHYCPDGRLTYEQTTMDYVVRFNHDVYGDVSATIVPEPEGEGNPIKEMITTYSRDRSKRIILMTHPNGDKQSWTHDGFGNPLTMTDIGGVVTNYERNLMGQVVHQWSQAAAGNQHGDIFKFTVTNYSGPSSEYKYQYAQAPFTGQDLTFIYDSNRLLRVTDAKQNIITTYEYNQGDLTTRRAIYFQGPAYPLLELLRLGNFIFLYTFFSCSHDYRLKEHFICNFIRTMIDYCAFTHLSTSICRILNQ